MKHGLIKAACASVEIRVADCGYNAKSILQAVDWAEQEGVSLLVLPELCVTGYTCSDLFFQRALQRAALEALLEIAEGTGDKDMLVLVGVPILYGAKLYNCAAVLHRGKVLGLVPKTYLPNYNEFYEMRQFSPAMEETVQVKLGDGEVPMGRNLLFACREVPELVLGVEICEDLWALEPPSTHHAAAGATVIANLSASNELVGKGEYRRKLVEGQSARLVCAYLYADAGEGESTTDLVFAGHNLIAENGVVLEEGPRYVSGRIVTEIDVQRLAFERHKLTTFPALREEGYERITFSLPLRETKLTRPVSPRPFIPADSAKRFQCCEDILAIQANGLKKRLVHTRAKTAVVGISGGLDSALALLVGVRAMDLLGRPRTDIIAVTMPCFGTTQRTKGNAEMLCERLGVTLRQIDIHAAVTQHFADIGHDEAVRDVTYENAQARERTQILMDVANDQNGMVIGTGDLSELALGWATYNGDHMSMYGVNASVPKTLVRYLVAHEAEQAGDGELKRVLLDILDTPVSPELLPADENGEINQKTEDLVGPYELHDFFLYYALRWGFEPEKVLRFALYAFAGEYDRPFILHWLRTFYRRFFAQQFKRSCLPDGPKVGSVALSPRGDWRMPSDAVAAVWLDKVDRLSSRAAED